MNNKNLSKVLMIVGIAMGACAISVWLTKHPFNCGIVAIGAICYFIGQYIDRGIN